MPDKSISTSVQNTIQWDNESIRLIISSAMDAIICIDSSGSIVLWNPRAETIFGWTEKEVFHKQISDLIIPEKYKERHKKGISHYLTSGEGIFINKVTEISAVNRKGHEFPVELTVIPFEHNGEKFFCSFLRDISEKTKVIEELKNSEKLFRLLIENSHDATNMVNQKGEIIYRSPAAERMTGFSLDEIKGKSHLELIHPEDQEEAAKFYQILLSEPGVPKNKTHRLLHKSGHYIWTEGIVTNLLHIPNVNAIISNFRDITEQKKSELELRQSETKYRSLIDQASDAIMITDHTGMFIDVNVSLLNMFGYSREELIGKNVSTVIEPAQIEKDPIRFDLLMSGHSVLRERRMMHRDGSIIEVEANVKMLPDGRMLAIARDITERKKAEFVIKTSEEKYKLLFNKNPLPMWIMSHPDMQIIDVNESAIQHYSYSKDEFISMSAKDIIVESDLPRFMKLMESDFEGTQHDYIFKQKVKNGIVIMVEISVHKVINEGKPASLVLSNDVTEKIIAEEKLKESHEQLRQLSSHLQSVREEERTRIAREIHDELGQKLTGLKMDASWLNRKIPATYAESHLRIDSMIELLDETVKTVRRISSELRPGILDDLGLIDALEWLSNDFEKRIGIPCHFSTQFGETEFDKHIAIGIYRVYQEALTNIARHSQATAIETTFKPVDGNILLTVSDNGKGFDENEVKSKKTLGLVGMKERASMFGGNLTVKSSDSKGTSVLLSIPMRNSNEKTAN